MKSNLIKLFASAFAVFAVSSVSAQTYLEDPRYGNSPEERKENVMTLNSFNDYVTTKDYDNALKQLNILLAKAPKATVNLYIRGAMIYKNKIPISKFAVFEKQNMANDYLKNQKVYSFSDL